VGKPIIPSQTRILNTSTVLRISGIAICFIAAALLIFLKPLGPGLSASGHVALGATLVAVGLWVLGGKWIPLAIGGVVLLLILIACGQPYPLVFNGFTARGLWILIPALFFGFALNTTGLGRRIAYWVIARFNPGYLTLTVSWVIIGLLLSVLTPSINVRIAIVIPIAVAVTEICKLRSGSSGASYILLAAWSMVLIPGTGWLTGSLWGPMAMGFFGSTKGLENVVTFDSWLKALFLPAMLLSLIFIILLFRFLKPKQEIKVDPAVFKAEYRALKPISFHEKATLIILAATFLALVTARWHGVPDVAICLAAFVLLVILGIIKVHDIGGGISWNLVIFFGTTMGLNTIFQQAGLSQYLGDTFAPIVTSLGHNAWLLLPGALIILTIWRFVDITQLYATTAFILPFMPVLALSSGIDPMVYFCIMMMTGDCFFAAYQQPFVVAAESVAGHSAWSPGHLRKAALLYTVACLLTVLACIPYWRLVGLIK
jgi:anion transporter